MDKEYFYLEGKDQRGPFSISEIKSFPQVKSNTLVWTEGMDNWKEAKDIDELKDKFSKSVPPPPPVINKIETLPALEDSNVKDWVTFKLVMFIIIVFAGIWIIGDNIVKSKRKAAENDIKEKIEVVFQGKAVVLDGAKTGVQGTLKDTGLGKAKNKENPFWFVEDWWEKDKLYTIYELESGGFTIKKLTKQNEGFDLETYVASDMGYRNPSTTYVKPEYSPWGDKISDGYTSRTFRQSVQQAYNDAFDFFTVDDKSGAYSPGKFVEISNFENISNEYFYLENTVPRTYSSTGVYSSEWEGQDHGANVYNDNWRVYYTSKGRHYEISEYESKIENELKKVIGIPSAIFVFLLVVIKLTKPKYFRNLYLFGKRWRSTSDAEQILFFDHSFFSQNTFKEIINSSLSKGLLKITDRGNTINFSYPNKEAFYKIETLDRDKLELISLADGQKSIFTRIGAKPNEPTKESERT